jgi:hypothetical protein
LDHISFALKKHEIDQEFSFKIRFQPSFWRRGNSKSVFSQVFGEGARTDFENPKVPPPGLTEKLNDFNRGGRACRQLVQRDQHGSMGSNAKRGHGLIELFNKSVYPIQ